MNNSRARTRAALHQRLGAASSRRTRGGVWVALSALLILAATFGARAAGASTPTLTELPGQPLPNSFLTGRTYTLSLIYQDADGDTVKKAQLIDDSAAGHIAIDDKSISPGSPTAGQTITWEVNGFAQGGHHDYFLVTNDIGSTARYPADATEQYSFTVDSLVTKWVITGVGVLVSLGFLPYIVFLGGRSWNRRGNPSSAARVGLLIGIVASLAIFIYEFVGLDNLVVLTIGVVTAICLFIVVLAKR